MYARGVDDLAGRVGAALAKVPAIECAYLFGSRASGKARPDSDLDVAVVIDGDPIAALRAAGDALAEALGALGDRVDLVDLDRAGAAVAFSVIRHGVRVLDRQPSRRVRREAWIARRYDDEALRRAQLRAAALAHAAAMGAEADGRR